MTIPTLSPPDRLGAESVIGHDPTRQAQTILALSEHLRDAVRRVRAAELSSFEAPGGVIIAGMGGSAIGARLAVGALGMRARRPIVVCDGYELPAWTRPDTLVVCASYSGATEETLGCFEQALVRGASVLAVTTGGPLAERAACDGVPVLRLPTGLQPRAAVAYALVAALEAAALAGAAPTLYAELESAATLAEVLATAWGPNGPADGLAKTLARRLDGTVPVILGAGLTAPVAYRWKCQMNENAKIPAFCSVLPEADHNEICGWADAGAFGAFSVVALEAPGAHPALARRAELTVALAAEGARVVERVGARGIGPLEQIVSLVLLGDLVSLYLAVLRGADPVEITAISKLKAALAQPAVPSSSR
jgi:glucose/mannose-6-phosphate isomerase